MNRFLRYTLKSLAWIFSILVVLYIIAFAYVSANKQKIIRQVTAEIGKKISGNITIADVNLSFFSHFPQVSVLLSGVSVTDTQYAKHHHVFFKGEQVYARVGMLKLIEGHVAINGISVSNGQVYLYTDSSGYSNSYLYLKKKDSTVHTPSENRPTELKLLELKNVRLVIDDESKNKLHDLLVHNLSLHLEERDSSYLMFNTDADILVHSLAFNKAVGSFIKDKTLQGKFTVGFDRKIGQVQVDSIDFNLSGQPFNITGSFDVAGKDPQFYLRVHTGKILYSYAKSLLTPKIVTALSIVDLDNQIDVDAHLNGPLNGGDPLITLNWRCGGTHLHTPFLDFENAIFSGYYTNEVTPGLPRKDPNSQIIIIGFKANWQGFPLTSDKISILNLTTPLMTCDLKSQFTLRSLNYLIGSKLLSLESGDGSAALTYRGPLEKNNNTNSFVNGEISFENGSLTYLPRSVSMKNLSGKLVFKNSDVAIENIECSILNNKIVMNGQARNLLTLVNTEPNKVKVNWNIYSPSVNLAAFTYLLKSRRAVSNMKRSSGGLAKIARAVDNVLEEGSLDITLKADRLMYKKFEASNVTASVSLLQSSYIINKVTMQNAGGNINLDGSLTQENNNASSTNKVKLNASIANVDVSRLFEAFNNFGQDGITAKSLEGKLTAKTNVSLTLTDDGAVLPSTVEGTVDFSLLNGALNNYEPVKKVQNILFKNRDFDNIRFAELKDRLELKNEEIKINRMEIQSSVLSMFVEGTYSNRGKTDMSIQVPFSNIKKRGADFNPENLGVEKKGGHGIYIRGRPGPDGKVQFKLDLFNKYKKQNSDT